MCSIIGQIIFGALMLVCLGLTLGAMFSPGWRDYGNGRRSGIFTGCWDPNDYDSNHNGGTTPSSQQAKDRCEKWWDNRPDWEKVVIVFLIISVILELITLAWTIASFCACCCREHFLKVLPPLALLTTLCLIVAIALFGAKHKNDIETVDNKQDLEDANDVSYSFWIGVAAILFGFCATIMGTITAFCAKNCI